MTFPFLGRARPAWVAAFVWGMSAVGLQPTDGMPFATQDPSFQGPRKAVSPTASEGPAAEDDPEIPARVELGADGRALILSGDLTEGVAARVAALLKAHPRISLIELTSDGGLVDEGKAIARLVAARGLSTYVPDACASACTLVFVRGRRRYLAADGRLGFHAPYEIGPDGRKHAVDPAPERAAYRAAGLPRSFVAEALRIAPADIWIPSPARLRAAGIVTEVVAAGHVPNPAVGYGQPQRVSAPREAFGRHAARGSGPDLPRDVGPDRPAYAVRARSEQAKAPASGPGLGVFVTKIVGSEGGI